MSVKIMEIIPGSYRSFLCLETTSDFIFFEEITSGVLPVFYCISGLYDTYVSVKKHCSQILVIFLQ